MIVNKYPKVKLDPNVKFTSKYKPTSNPVSTFTFASKPKKMTPVSISSITSPLSLITFMLLAVLTVLPVLTTGPTLARAETVSLDFTQTDLAVSSVTMPTSTTDLKVDITTWAFPQAHLIPVVSLSDPFYYPGGRYGQYNCSCRNVPVGISNASNTGQVPLDAFWSVYRNNGINILNGYPDNWYASNANATNKYWSQNDTLCNGTIYFTEGQFSGAPHSMDWSLVQSVDVISGDDLYLSLENITTFDALNSLLSNENSWSNGGVDAALGVKVVYHLVIPLLVMQRWCPADVVLSCTIPPCEGSIGMDITYTFSIYFYLLGPDGYLATLRQTDFSITQIVDTSTTSGTYNFTSVNIFACGSFPITAVFQVIQNPIQSTQVSAFLSYLQSVTDNLPEAVGDIGFYTVDPTFYSAFTHIQVTYSGIPNGLSVGPRWLTTSTTYMNLTDFIVSDNALDCYHEHVIFATGSCAPDRSTTSCTYDVYLLTGSLPVLADGTIFQHCIASDIARAPDAPPLVPNDFDFYIKPWTCFLNDTGAYDRCLPLCVEGSNDTVHIHIEEVILASAIETVVPLTATAITTYVPTFAGLIGRQDTRYMSDSHVVWLAMCEKNNWFGDAMQTKLFALASHGSLGDTYRIVYLNASTGAVESPIPLPAINSTIDVGGAGTIIYGAFTFHQPTQSIYFINSLNTSNPYLGVITGYDTYVTFEDVDSLGVAHIQTSVANAHFQPPAYAPLQQTTAPLSSSAALFGLDPNMIQNAIAVALGGKPSGRRIVTTLIADFIPSNLIVNPFNEQYLLLFTSIVIENPTAFITPTPPPLTWLISLDSHTGNVAYTPCYLGAEFASNDVYTVSSLVYYPRNPNTNDALALRWADPHFDVMHNISLPLTVVEIEEIKNSGSDALGNISVPNSGIGVGGCVDKIVLLSVDPTKGQADFYVLDTYFDIFASPSDNPDVFVTELLNQGTFINCNATIPTNNLVFSLRLPANLLFSYPTAMTFDLSSGLYVITFQSLIMTHVVLANITLIDGVTGALLPTPHVSIESVAVTSAGFDRLSTGAIQVSNDHRTASARQATCVDYRNELLYLTTPANETADVFNATEVVLDQIFANLTNLTQLQLQLPTNSSNYPEDDLCVWFAVDDPEKWTSGGQTWLDINTLDFEWVETGQHINRTTLQRTAQNKDTLPEGTSWESFLLMFSPVPLMLAFGQDFSALVDLRVPFYATSWNGTQTTESLIYYDSEPQPGTLYTDIFCTHSSTACRSLPFSGNYQNSIDGFCVWSKLFRQFWVVVHPPDSKGKPDPSTFRKVKISGGVHWGETFSPKDPFYFPPSVPWSSDSYSFYRRLLAFNGVESGTGSKSGSKTGSGTGSGSSDSSDSGDSASDSRSISRSSSGISDSSSDSSSASNDSSSTDGHINKKQKRKNLFSINSNLKNVNNVNDINEPKNPTMRKPLSHNADWNSIDAGIAIVTSGNFSTTFVSASSSFIFTQTMIDASCGQDETTIIILQQPAHHKDHNTEETFKWLGITLFIVFFLVLFGFIWWVVATNPNCASCCSNGIDK